jgi:hypothetical protein
MHVLTVLLLNWSAILGVLQEAPAEDQFAEEVSWSTFASKPFVLVFADRESSERGKEIGAALHSTFNGDYVAPKNTFKHRPPPRMPTLFRLLRCPMYRECSNGYFVKASRQNQA